ncbi:WxL domain-containing protein [Enterococcus sp.]|uniref:WxL domain-containing protein n=1 Tax=Enterococcus sp. TaxID=35783 RepID=UPI0025C2B766|nr:WxL domain-containing protein [Enterococcus sp.]
MKKLVTAVAFVGLGMALPISVQAAEVAAYHSNGQIIFEPNTEPTDPISPTDPDPENPIKPVDPTTPGGDPEPGTTGPLSIDFASSLYFGTQIITSKTETYYAAPQEYVDSKGTGQQGPNFVQVTDNRGTESGWTLHVKQNGQFKTAEDQELQAAQIRLKNGTIVTPSDSPKPSHINGAITLNPNGAESLVMSAQEGEGAGTYLMSWGDSLSAALKSVELEVPGSTTKYATKYSTTLTWLLTDTPTNP